MTHLIKHWAKRPYRMLMRHSQQGVAVISAMLLAALTTVIVSQLIWEQQVLLSELENHQDSAQARMIGYAAVQWSRAILAEDAKTSKTDHLKEPWARKLPLVSVEGGKVEGEIIDQQRFFNLTSLENEGSSREIFTRLLNKLQLPKALTSSIGDWIDKDDNVSGADGAESFYYQSLVPPYRAGNHVLIEVGNLNRVKFVDDAVLQTLSPWITALPAFTEININTASPSLLALIFADSNASIAPSIIAQRNQMPFKDIGDLQQRLGGEVDVGQLPLTTESRFFSAYSTVLWGKSAVHIEALLLRDSTGWPKIVWQRTY